jgi:hypothetical protein
MAQILVWECEQTGELFRTEEEYRKNVRKNVRKLKKQQALEERAKRARDAEIEALQPMYRRSTFRALEKWILDNSELIRRFGREHWAFGRDRPDGNLLKVHLSGMHWGHHSCSHSAPLGKPKNWGGTGDPNPRTYLGWRGKIELYFDGSSHRLNDSLSAVGVCTGGGGGGNYKGGYRTSYEVTLWDDDFPRLRPKDMIENSTTSFGARSLASAIHDIFHFDRAPPHWRAENWQRLIKNVSLVRDSNANTGTAYCPLWSYDSENRDIDFARRAFGKTHPYFITGDLDYDIRERLRFRGGSDDVLFLGNMSGLPLVCVDPEPFIGHLLSGKFRGRIVALNRKEDQVGLCGDFS